MPNAPIVSPMLAAVEHAVSLAPDSDLADVARRLGVSKRTLQRLLNRAGSRFSEQRTNARLARAEALLRADMKVSAVANEVGFASTGHFILWFRRHRGATPGAWRTRQSAPPHDATALGAPAVIDLVDLRQVDIAAAPRDTARS